jgi:hypothetical protein
VTRTQDLQAKADHFASRAGHARNRTARNTNLSLEQSYRSLAADEERTDAANPAPDAETPNRPAAHTP